jgi:hypothetical protein
VLLFVKYWVRYVNTLSFVSAKKTLITFFSPNICQRNHPPFPVSLLYPNILFPNPPCNDNPIFKLTLCPNFRKITLFPSLFVCHSDRAIIRNVGLLFQTDATGGLTNSDKLTSHKNVKGLCDVIISRDVTNFLTSFTSKDSLIGEKKSKGDQKNKFV